MVPGDRELLTGVPAQFTILARDLGVLHEFTRESTQMKTLNEFINQLTIRVAQIEQPSAAYQAARESALETPDEAKLFEGVSSHNKALFVFQMGKLNTDLQDKITDWQKQTGFVSAKDRVELLLPLSRYLGTFSQQEQQLWGEEYLHHLEFMSLSLPGPLLTDRLSGRPMSFTDNESLWGLANSAVPGQEAATFKLLQKAMNGHSPTHRLRMQTRCEGLINQLPPSEKGPFLIAFNKVMVQFHERKDWGTFVKLVDKTAKWWNVNEGTHRTELQTLWLHMAENSNLTAIRELLEVGLSGAGKSWFQSMLIAFKHISPALLCQLQKKHWQMLPQFNMTDRLNPHFTAEGTQQSLKSLEQWLSHWNKKGDATTLINSILPTYRSFLQTLAEKEPPAFNTGASWYLAFAKSAPTARAQLDLLVAQPERRIILSQLMREFTDQRFNDLESSALLRTALDNKIDDVIFSECCQALSILNEILATTALFTVEEKVVYHHRLLQLPSDKLLALLPVLLKHQTQLKANSSVLVTLLSYGEDVNLSAIRVAHLATVLIQAAGSTTQTPQALDHLILGVNRFKQDEMNDATVEQLLLLMQGQGALATDQILFDNVAHYLHTHVHPGRHLKVKQVIDWFYRAAKSSRGDVESMQRDAKLAELFDFEKDSESLRNQRVIWMHLLNHSAFVTGKDYRADLDTNAFQWNNKDNQSMLQYGFNLYISETKKRLAHRPETNVLLDRDLSVTQQSGLLRLADELAIIGAPQLNWSSPEHQTNIRSMKDGLDQLVGNYQSSWFKSSSRKNQFAELQQQVMRHLENGSGRTQSRYEEVIHVIRKARIDAMRQDIIDNQNRYFMLNKSGHSRFFSTLNQMEDLVVRSWVQDTSVVQSFQNYKALCNKEMIELSQQLHQALNVYHERNHLRTQTIGQRISHWFTHDDRAVITNVLGKLLSFNNKHISRDEPLTDESLSTLSKALQKYLPHLPGHVQTLAKEVLMRSEALVTHLGETNDHPTREILASH